MLLARIKKFTVIIVTPLVAIILISLKFPKVENEINKMLGEGAIVIIQVFLIFATLLTYYVTVYAPYLKYEELSKARWLIIDTYANQLTKHYMAEKEGSLKLSCHILTPKWRFLSKIEPSKKNPDEPCWKFGCRVFDCIWSQGEGVNKEFKFTVNQGLSGKVYRQAKRIMGEEFTDRSKHKEFHFTDKQLQQTGGLVILVSCPIVRKSPTINKVKEKIVGVLNVESHSQGAETLILNKERQGNLYMEIENLSGLCSKLL